jgi:hypothetical protein
LRRHLPGPSREPTTHGTCHPSKDLSDELKLGATWLVDVGQGLGTCYGRPAGTADYWGPAAVLPARNRVPYCWRQLSEKVRPCRSGSSVALIDRSQLPRRSTFSVYKMRSPRCATGRTMASIAACIHGVGYSAGLPSSPLYRPTIRADKSKENCT